MTGIIAVVHEHLDVIENAGVQILGFINGEEERLAFLLVEIGDLFLDRLKHTSLSAFVRDAKNGAELFNGVKTCKVFAEDAQDKE